MVNVKLMRKINETQDQERIGVGMKLKNPEVQIM